MKQLWLDFKQRPLWRKVLDVAVLLFALAGFAIIGAWALYQTGITNNRGAVDKNYRYLLSVSEMENLTASQLTPQRQNELWSQQCARLAAFGRYYPVNARLIMQAAQSSGNPAVADRMLAAAEMYIDDASPYNNLADELVDILTAKPQQQRPNVIPWMNTPEWEALRTAIARDSALINEAGRLTGVEPRLIVGCLVGEQIRLFNSKREMFKKYLGPVKMLSVQSQFSYGVNGIKDFTAEAVEQHLKDPTSEFYMGRGYEHLLDFETDDHVTERYNRLVDYRNHLYSYIYTGCILHQTMLQWRRAGYDISDRPDILFTLFNVGFSQSVPKADPVCGGSHIEVDGRMYTFGALGFDFYYSGELANIYPFQAQRFIEKDRALTQQEIEQIQANMSNCSRPQRGLEYRRDSADANPAATLDEPPDPFGIDHSQVQPLDHIPQ
ncbi:MAG: hypothetical protein K5650_08440 [Bacteroidales bacterium]|nr:hypothetical protein [Bacteroidales bacterium]